MTRLASHMLVGAMLRGATRAGGFAAVLARGEAEAGAILLVTCEKGGDFKLLERGIGPDGAPAWIPAGPSDADGETVTAYWQRRRARDPDLWVIELDIPAAERFAAETSGFY